MIKDRNGYILSVGDKVVDAFGRKGEVVSVNGAEAIRFDVKGGVRYVFKHKLDSSSIQAAAIQEGD